jgi:hypothetical protein
VVHRNAPEIRGTVIALRHGEAKVYWPAHTTTWTHLESLRPVTH